MKLARFYSPTSPVRQLDEPSVDELTLERKQNFLPQLKNWYNWSLQDFQEKLTKHEMATNRNKSIRRKRKLECSGCSNKQCTLCSLNAANKKMRDYGEYIGEIEAEIETLKRRIDLQRIASPLIPPCPVPAFVDSDEEESNNENDSDEVKQEADVKQEPEDSFVSFQFTPSMGMINTVKSEPMGHSNEDQNQSEDESSEDESSEESTDQSMQEESQNTEASYRDYPSTPDYTTSEEDTDNESEDDNEDRRPMRSILNLLNE